MKDFLTWLIRSRVACAGLTALLGLTPLLNPLSGGVVALVVLRRSWLEGVVTTVGAGIIIAIVAAAFARGGWLVSTLPMVSMWCVVIVLAMVLRRTASLALVMQVATLLGCIGVVVFFVLHPDPEQFWTPVLEHMLKPMLEGAKSGTTKHWTSAIERLALLTTGILGGLMVLSSTISVLCGRWAQAVLYNPGGFRGSFHRLRMGWVATIIASVLFVLAGLFSNALINNLAIVLLVMFMYQGLAVIHGISGLKKWHPGWLVGFYVLFVLEFLPVLGTVSGLGLIDNWFDLRAWAARKRG